MAGMRYGDVNGVDLGVGEQRVVAIENAGAGKRLGQACLAGIAGAERDNRAGARACHAAGERFGDVAGPEYPPADGRG